MAIVLGIDTGGTYTDGVIIDLESHKILAATKASTTHRDLIVGIRNTINQLDMKNWTHWIMWHCPPLWPPMPLWKTAAAGWGYSF